MNPLTPVIVAARRTPFGTAGRSLAHLRAEQLAAPVLRALLDDLGLEPSSESQPSHKPSPSGSPGPDSDLGYAGERDRRSHDRGDDCRSLPQVADVILGNCMGPGGNIARVSALAAGLDPAVPGLTVDRQCGSGLEAITIAAALVRAGRGAFYLAGGVESASTAPIRSWRPDATHEMPRSYERAPFAPPPYADPDMGEAADALARERGITRERQDAYAARSHARAVAAAQAKRYAAELVPVAGVDHDERPRAGLTAARLARLRPAFVPEAEGGTVTAGNSCGVNDGAAAVAVVPEHVRARYGWPGLEIVDWACTGTDPDRPGLGLVSSVHAILDRQPDLGLDDIETIEFVEAFAAQVLACADALRLDPDRICRDGGALALGHPWGATGALTMVRLFTQMVRQNSGDGSPYGLAAASIGGGMGIAVLVRRIDQPGLP
ncbi:MAG TPA: thiolase family protein [Actinopolymorphaceae bacterium]|jgi:acetyl-CoA C-acetyltransferase